MIPTQPSPASPQATPPAGLDQQQILQQYITDDLLNGRLQVDVDDDLLGGEIIDSLGMMWLVAFIEETFGVSVPLEDITIQNFRTIETIQAYVQRRASHGVE